MIKVNFIGWMEPLLTLIWNRLQKSIRRLQIPITLPLSCTLRQNGVLNQKCEGPRNDFFAKEFNETFMNDVEIRKLACMFFLWFYIVYFNWWNHRIEKDCHSWAMSVFIFLYIFKHTTAINILILLSKLWFTSMY